MKIGIRKPSLKKSLKARTTGKLKRSVKKALIPGYGKKGMGWIKNPKKAVYNKIYNKTSVSLFPAGISIGKPSRKPSSNTMSKNNSQPTNHQFNSIIDGGLDTMKVCKFCGTENLDFATVCSSCGANEFKHKCSNCGTVFEGGNFCPKCGIKSSAKAKKCPNCGSEYYSVACPDCGYIHNIGKATIVYANATVQPSKKRKTWLWVLGWIFIFPVPLTILMKKNQKLNKGLKIGVIAVAWIIYLLIAFSDSSSDDSRSPANSAKEFSQPVVAEAIDSANNTEIIANKIVDDEVVNYFLCECDFDYGKIENGNIRTKYFVHMNGCRTELLNSNTDELIVKINGYHIDNINEPEVLDAFRVVANVINENQYEAELAELIEGLSQHNTELYEGEIGNLKYRFHAFVELSKGVSESWMEIRTAKYNNLP